MVNKKKPAKKKPLTLTQRVARLNRSLMFERIKYEDLRIRLNQFHELLPRALGDMKDELSIDCHRYIRNEIDTAVLAAAARAVEQYGAAFDARIGHILLEMGDSAPVEEFKHFPECRHCAAGVELIDGGGSGSGMWWHPSLRYSEYPTKRRLILCVNKHPEQAKYWRDYQETDLDG